MKKLLPLIVIVIVGLVIAVWYMGRPGVNTPVVVGVPNTDTNTAVVADSRYVPYTQSAFESSGDKKRVYFFHASWCPTCKAANTEFEANLDRIPEDVILLKTDYDSNTELKKQYNITYQHTYVLVDNAGNEIKKWNGGSIDELIENTR